jgi:hypothetical protein
LPLSLYLMSPLDPRAARSFTACMSAVCLRKVISAVVSKGILWRRQGLSSTGAGPAPGRPWYGRSVDAWPGSAGRHCGDQGRVRAVFECIACLVVWLRSFGGCAGCERA